MWRILIVGSCIWLVIIIIGESLVDGEVCYNIDNVYLCFYEIYIYIYSYYLVICGI